MTTQRKDRRRYSSPVREEAARRTRAAILAAATRLFVEDGYDGTSFDAVARAAGVARPTVVTSFGTKAALLSQVLDRALAGDDEPVPVADRPWFRPVWDAPDGPGVLRAYAGVCVLIGSRAGRVVEALHRASDSHTETAALWERWLETRRAGAAMVVERDVLAADLRRDLTRRTAGDVLWTLNDPGLYVALVHRQGWSEPDFQRWLGDSMGRLLLRSVGPLSH